jgi:hypothetical protein
MPILSGNHARLCQAGGFHLQRQGLAATRIGGGRRRAGGQGEKQHENRLAHGAHNCSTQDSQEQV